MADRPMLTGTERVKSVREPADPPRPFTPEQVERSIAKLKAIGSRAFEQLYSGELDDMQRILDMLRAYAMETAVRYATEATHGWPTLSNEARILADFLRKEVAESK